MSDICDAKEDWEDKDSDEKFEFLEDFTLDMMKELGYDGQVNVKSGSLEGECGEWNYSTKTVTYDEDCMNEENFDDLVETVVHEATHASDDLEAGKDLEMGEGTYYEKSTYKLNEDGSETKYEKGYHPSPEHQSVYDFADGVADQFTSECEEEEDESSESASEKDMPDNKWNLPPDANEAFV